MDGERLKIVVCDDDAETAAAVAGYARRLCDELGCPAEVDAYTDGSLLLDAWPAGVDFLFLDVEMPLVSGMEVAREVRARDSRVAIVFVTSFDRYAVKGYEVGAYRYLLKPLPYERFAEEMAPTFRCAIRERSPHVYLKSEGTVYCLRPYEILYVETRRNHRIAAHLADRQIEAYGTMAQMETLFADASFFKCHASYLVNLACVASFAPDALVMDDGASIPVSKHRRRALKEAFLAYASGAGA